VGNDWETLRRQITGGLGLQAAGVPWWTYDAGGFFRPRDQYNNKDYINRMLRWIELSVYLPLMRVHGYMSDTEPWRYGATAQSIITRCINERKSLFPYIYSNAAEVSFNGSTLMRPLVFDFYNDPKALEQKYEYMFGKALLISPVTEPDVTEWETYLPENKGGWYDYHSLYANEHYNGGQTVKTKIGGTILASYSRRPLPEEIVKESINSVIPIFVKAGSIIIKRHQPSDKYLTVHIYPGQDTEFTLYEDDGETNNYKNGEYCKTLFSWNDSTKSLTINKIDGNWSGKQKFSIWLRSPNIPAKIVNFKGKLLTVKFK